MASLKLPTMHNLTGFIDRYNPFDNPSAKTTLPYNKWSPSQGRWVFSMDVHDRWANGGLPLDFSEKESPLRRTNTTCQDSIHSSRRRLASFRAFDTQYTVNKSSF